MKKLLVLGIVFLMVMGVMITGCADEQVDPETDPVTQEPVTIVFYSTSGFDEYYNEVLIPMFEKEYAGKYEVIYARGGTGEIISKIRAQGDDVRINILTVGLDGWAAGMEAGLWEELYPRHKTAINHDRLNEMAKGYIERHDGKGVAIFVDHGGPAIAYNRDRVPNPPRTFAALKEWVEQNPGKFMYAAIPHSGPARGFYFGLIQSLGEDMHNPDALTLTWDYLKEIGETIEVYPSGTSPTFTFLFDGTVDIVAHTPTWFAGSYSRGELPPNIGLAILEDAKQLTDTHAFVIPKNLSERRKEAALTFLSFAMSAEPQAQLFARAKIPANKDAKIEHILPEYKELFNRVMEIYPQELTDGSKLVISEETSVLFPDPATMLRHYELWNEKIGAGR